MAIVRFRGSRAELVTLLRTLVDAVTGAGPDRLAVARPVLARGAVALLSRIQGAFVQKARGGVGDDGIQWEPLKRKTIAARRTSRAELKSFGVSGRRERGLLTPAENKRWRAIYASTLAQLRARGVAGAESLAAQRAWGILKAAGAKTKLDVLGGRVVEIGRDTGALLNSLTPGLEESPVKPADQILEAEPGRITVGSNKPYAEHFHAKRPLWPADGTLPDAWWDAVGQAIARGLLAVIMRAAATGARA